MHSIQEFDRQIPARWVSNAGSNTTTLYNNLNQLQLTVGVSGGPTGQVNIPNTLPSTDFPGGNGNQTSASAEVFEPIIQGGRFVPTLNPMANSRSRFSLLQLQTGGILAPGGGQYPNPTSPIQSIGQADVFSPSSVYTCPTCHFPPVWYCGPNPLACLHVLLSPTVELWGRVPNSIAYMSLPRLAVSDVDLRARKFPLHYHIVITGIGGNWSPALFDSSDNRLPAEQTNIRDGVVLTRVFADATELQEAVSNSTLAIQMTGHAVPGRRYKALIRVELADH